MKALLPTLLLPLALALPAFAAADATGPAGAAIRFVEKLRSNDLDLAPDKDTAISPATGTDKRKLIADRARLLGRELGPGSVEAGAQKVDGDMAAVLVHQEAAGFDPSRLRVIAIGLIRKNGGWLPAPVPGSFENTGLGYDASRTKRLSELETWMLHEQVTELSTLRDQSSERLRKAIEGSLSKDDIRHFTAEQVVGRLLAACAKRDQASILGLIGGLQAELPEDWSERVAAVGQACTAEAPAGAWHYLTGKGVIRTVIGASGGEGSVDVDLACLDASGEVGRPLLPQLHRLLLELQKDAKGFWRIDLPVEFFGKTDGNEEPRDSTIAADELPKVVNAWRRDHPLAAASSARAASDAALTALAAPDPDGLLSLIDLEGNAANAILGVSRLAQIWRDLHHPRDIRTALPIAFHEEGDGAVSAFQVFWSREPEHEDVRRLCFFRNQAGWQLLSGLRPAKPPQETIAAAAAWADDQTAGWAAHWMEFTLASSAKLEAIPEGEAPLEDATRSAFENWNAAILRGDVPAIIGGTARLTRDKAGRLLQNLGAELTAANKVGRKAAILGIIRKGPWAAVSVRIGAPGDEDAVYPLYPFVNTQEGPRVLAQVDLFANGGRTRSYLNNTTFERLQTLASDSAVTALREIYEIHRKNAETDRPPVPDTAK